MTTKTQKKTWKSKQWDFKSKQKSRQGSKIGIYIWLRTSTVDKVGNNVCWPYAVCLAGSNLEEAPQEKETSAEGLWDFLG